MLALSLVMVLSCALVLSFLCRFVWQLFVIFFGAVISLSCCLSILYRLFLPVICLLNLVFAVVTKSVGLGSVAWGIFSSARVVRGHEA